MISNAEFVRMLDEDGSLEFLLVHGGLLPEDIEDPYLGGLLEEVKPFLEEINERIESIRKEVEEREDSA